MPVVSWFRSAWEPRIVAAHEVSWERLAERLTTHPPPPPLPWACSARCSRKRWRRPGGCPGCGAALLPDKFSLPAWSPWTFSGPTRTTTAAQHTAAMVLDYDGGATAETIRATWAAWRHVAHTSWSHTADVPRWRVVLPLLEPVPSAAWSRAWAWAVARDGTHDATCKDPGRLYFLPFDSGDRPCDAWAHDGPVLGIDSNKPPAPDDDRPTRRHVARGHLDRSRAHRLRTDVGQRRTLGEQLGGRVCGSGESERVQGVTCPACSRKSVWWAVHPRSWAGAACSHKTSCGWSGWLDQLEQAA